MTTPKRYFINSLTDYAGGPVKIDAALWTRYIKDTAENCVEKLAPHPKNFDGGLYVGVAGLAYMFFSLSQSKTFSQDSGYFLSQALDIIRFCEDSIENLGSRRKTDECGFLLGNAGVYALAAAAYHLAGNGREAARNVEKYSSAATICTPPNFVSFGGDEFLVGRAGYIAGALWLNKIFQKEVISPDKINMICNSIVEYGRSYSKKKGSPCPLMYSYYKTEYLGAAHGLSSILQMLLCCDNFLNSHPDVEKDVKASVDFLLSLQTESGNFPCALDELGRSSRPESDELVHWCHGAPGVIYLMAKAHSRWKDRHYLESAIKCGELTWRKGLLTKGPGICHGIAGSGYVFLLLYRLTGDEKYLHRASQFANFLLTDDFKRARIPDSPYSLYEGWAGTVCFLNDLLNPGQASFPFMEV